MAVCINSLGVQRRWSAVPMLPQRKPHSCVKPIPRYKWHGRLRSLQGRCVVWASQHTYESIPTTTAMPPSEPHGLRWDMVGAMTAAMLGSVALGYAVGAITKKLAGLMRGTRKPGVLNTVDDEVAGRYIFDGEDLSLVSPQLAEASPVVQLQDQVKKMQVAAKRMQNKLKAQFVEKEQELEKAMQTITTLENELDSVGQAMRKREEELVAVRGAARAQEEQGRAVVEESSRRVALLEAMVVSLRGKLSQEEDKNKGLEDALSANQDQLHLMEGQRLELSSQVEELKKQLHDTQGKLAEAEAHARRLQADMEESASSALQLEKWVTELEQQIRSQMVAAASRAEEAERKLHEVQNAAASSQQRVLELQQEINQQENALEMLQQALQEAYLGREEEALARQDQGARHGAEKAELEQTIVALQQQQSAKIEELADLKVKMERAMALMEEEAQERQEQLQQLADSLTRDLDEAKEKLESTQRDLSQTRATLKEEMVASPVAPGAVIPMMTGASGAWPTTNGAPAPKATDRKDELQELELRAIYLEGAIFKRRQEMELQQQVIRSRLSPDMLKHASDMEHQLGVNLANLDRVMAQKILAGPGGSNKFTAIEDQLRREVQKVQYELQLLYRSQMNLDMRQKQRNLSLEVKDMEAERTILLQKLNKVKYGDKVPVSNGSTSGATASEGGLTVVHPGVPVGPPSGPDLSVVAANGHSWGESVTTPNGGSARVTTNEVQHQLLELRSVTEALDQQGAQLQQVRQVYQRDLQEAAQKLADAQAEVNELAVVMKQLQESLKQQREGVEQLRSAADDTPISRASTIVEVATQMANEQQQGQATKSTGSTSLAVSPSSAPCDLSPGLTDFSRLPIQEAAEKLGAVRDTSSPASYEAAVLIWERLATLEDSPDVSSGQAGTATEGDVRGTRKAADEVDLNVSEVSSPSPDECKEGADATTSRPEENGSEYLMGNIQDQLTSTGVHQTPPSPLYEDPWRTNRAPEHKQKDGASTGQQQDSQTTQKSTMPPTLDTAAKPLPTTPSSPAPPAASSSVAMTPDASSLLSHPQAQPSVMMAEKSVAQPPSAPVARDRPEPPMADRAAPAESLSEDGKGGVTGGVSTVAASSWGKPTSPPAPDTNKLEDREVVAGKDKVKDISLVTRGLPQEVTSLDEGLLRPVEEVEAEDKAVPVKEGRDQQGSEMEVTEGLLGTKDGQEPPVLDPTLAIGDLKARAPENTATTSMGSSPPAPAPDAVSPASFPSDQELSSDITQLTQALMERTAAATTTTGISPKERTGTVVMTPRLAPGVIPPAPGPRRPMPMLQLLSAGCIIPHVKKEETGGEDAFFVSNAGCGGIGVADGVGGWSEEGVDASLYAKSLMVRCAEIIEGTQGAEEVVDVLEYAQETTQLPGSSTICLAVLRPGGVLDVANLGDSGLRVLRGGKCIFKTEIQEHQFNMPYQMASPTLFEGTDLADDADTYSITVQAGDVVILGTDGLYDNLWDEELEQVIVKKLGRRAPSRLDKSTLQGLAKSIAKRAFEHAKDPNFKSPFAMEVAKRREGSFMSWLFPRGGKMDDVTVVVAVVRD